MRLFPREALVAIVSVALTGLTSCDGGRRVGADSLGSLQQGVDNVLIAASAGTTTFTAQGSAVVVEPNLTLAGTDNFDGATVRIATGFASGQDVLDFTASGGVTGSYDASTGILSLSGSASPATYQTILRSVTYHNTGGATPNTQARAVTFSLGSSLNLSGTNHYYGYVASAGITWEAAKIAAANSTYLGLHGYLATVTSSEENSYIQSKFGGNNQGWMGAMATLTPSDPSNSTGYFDIPRNWYWVTGPEAGTLFYQQTARCPNAAGSAVNNSYNNWASGEPNDWSPDVGLTHCPAPGVEAWGHFYADGTWNDYAYTNNFISGYVVEYGGMPTDPTPVLTATRQLQVIAVSSVAVSASPNPVAFGQASTLTATVTPSNATGTVQFSVDGSNFGSPVAVSGGAASIESSTSLAVGSYSVAATYSGDTADLGSSGTLPGGLTVSQASTTVAVSSSQNPSPQGASLSFTAAVTPSSATGTIQFTIDSANFGSPVTLASGSATSASLASLAPGTHSVGAIYSGDSSYLTSTGALSGGQQVIAPVCGNGAIEYAEQCDDLNANPADGCSATCQAEPGWTCPSGGGACTTVCGDGILTASEQCDDRNTVNGDGCSSSCAVEAGFACFFTTENLVQNGSFDSGSTGWTSQYTWADPSGSNVLVPDGTWSVSGSPNGLHPAIPSGIKDAEGSASNGAAFFNGALTSRDALVQGVALTAGKIYVLSVSGLNWNPSAGPSAALAVSLGGQRLTPDVVLSSSAWQRFGSTFTAASTGSSSLELWDSATASSGNDFAVDAVMLCEAAAERCRRTCAKDADCEAVGTGYWCDATAMGHPPLCTAPLPSGDPIPDVPSRDASDPPLGGACTTPAAGAVCISKECNPVQNTCAEPTRGPCASNAQCVSDICNSDHACGCAAAADCASFSSTYCELSTHTCDALIATTAAVAASSNPASKGQPVHFTATLSPSDAAGSVQFTIDGQSWGLPVALSGGVAISPEIANLSLGSHSVEAIYLGDGKHLGCTGSLAGGLAVQKATTATALAASPNPSVFGQSIHLSAEVTTASTAVPTGSVAFSLGATSLGSAALDGSGKASFDLASLAVGANSITASYSGDSDHEESASAPLSQVVHRAATTTVLSAAPNPALRVQKVTLTAQIAVVAPGAGSPAGTVTFMNGETILGTAAATAGAASLELSHLAIGDHTFTAVFGESESFSGSSSAPVAGSIQPSCAIGSALYAAHAENPANSCQLCEPAENTTDWTNRPSGFACAADALSCTRDLCDSAGLCAHPRAEGCIIENACVPEGASSPSRECMQCNPALATVAYTPKPKGASCADDGSALTDDLCDGTGQCVHPPKGLCIIGGVTYSSGAPNPDNACQSCDALADDSHWTNRVEGFSCAGDGLSCTWDACDGSGTCGHRLFQGCLVGGACVASGTTDPDDSCRECNPALATNAYSPRARGIVCADDGDSSTRDICNGAGTCAHPARGQCTIGEVDYDEGTANPQNPCQTCDPAATSQAWTHRPAGFPCASDGLECTRDACDGAGACQHTLFAGCLIGGACIGEHAPDPTAECRSCNPASSTGGYVAKPQGAACSDDQKPNTVDVCDNAGICTHPHKRECSIGGSTYGTGATNPQNPCQACDPTSTASAWTNRAEGFSCTSDGLACTNDVCNGAGSCEHRLFRGCLIAEACVGEGALHSANACRACNPSSSKTDYSNRAQGLLCADDGNPNTLDACDGAGSCQHALQGHCTVGSITYLANASNPENPCQFCEPAVSVLSWTNRAATYPCTEDGFSCTEDACDDDGACQHSLASGCAIEGSCVAPGVADAMNPCIACVAAVSTRAYSPRPRGIACGDDGDPRTTDLCDGSGACIHPPNSECTIADQTFDSGAANPSNPCQWCDPSASMAAWSNRVTGFACTPDGLSCTRDACDGAGLCRHELETGCLIGGACLSAGTLDPTSDCRECNPAASTSAFSLKRGSADCAGSCTVDHDCPAGTLCAADQVCRPRYPDNHDCSADLQCESGHCLSGRCARYAMTGGCGCSHGAEGETAALFGAAAAFAVTGLRRRRGATSQKEEQ